MKISKFERVSKKFQHPCPSLAGESITDDEIDDLFMAGDRNSDGKLDFDEWVALMADMEGAINLSV